MTSLRPLGVVLLAVVLVGCGGPAAYVTFSGHEVAPRQVAATITEASEATLIREGYVRIGTIKQLVSLRRQDATAQLLSSAALYGGDLVKLVVDNEQRADTAYEEGSCIETRWALPQEPGVLLNLVCHEREQNAYKGQWIASEAEVWSQWHNDLNTRSALSMRFCQAAAENDAKIVDAVIATGELSVDAESLVPGASCCASPLYWASEAGHEGIVAFLLEHGADVNSRADVSGRTPLDAAVGNRKFGVVNLLLAATPNAQTLAAAIGVSAAAGDSDAIRLFAAKGVKIGTTALDGAIRAGQVALFKELLVQGVDPSRATTWAAIEGGQTEVVKSLWSRGLGVIPLGKYESSPLTKPVEQGNLDLVRFLLEQGADPRSGKPYSHLCTVVLNTDNVEMARLLIDHGADVNDNKCMYNPILDEAVLNDRLALTKLLLSRGSSSHARLHRLAESDEMRTLLREAGID